ncbi:hypothetical protein [Streptomyces griseoluteus]|uniref:hypothetical protein n=1 Tax=Streptomyces griseoluteus TaxID=29306 RepID=UPI00343414DC
MSTERECESEVYGAHEAVGAAPVPPIVFHPPAAPAPSYEGYADPAAAHGWQSAYDETRELPALTELPAPDGPMAPGAVKVGDAARGRSGRGRRAAGRRRRRVLVAGAVTGTVGAVAVIAGLVASSSPSGGDRPATTGRATSGTSGVPAGPGVPDPTPSAGAVAAGDGPSASPARVTPAPATAGVSASDGPSAAQSVVPAGVSAVEETPSFTTPATTATVPAAPSTPAPTGTPTRGGKRHRHH